MPRLPGRIALVLLVASAALPADDTHQDEPHHKGPHHVGSWGVFVGSATEGVREGDLTLGLEYSHYLAGKWAVAAVAEYSFTNDGTWVFVVPAVYNMGDWRLFAGPGIERHAGETEFLARTGVGYAFELENDWEIEPQFNIDWVDGDGVVVWGLYIARTF
jgi:hypothetical protein